MLVLLPAQMMAAYLMTYVQIPRLLNSGHFLWFSISTLLVAYLLAILSKLSIIYIASPLTGAESFDETIGEIAGDPIYLVRVFVVSIYTPAILMFLIKMTQERFRQQNRVAILEKEKRTNELNFLKAQMNPHFLFNTLNNIYSLSKTGSASTSELILKLSEILDYTIYECSKETVPISKEWELIENYVELEALRYGGELHVALNQQIEDHDLPVAPLILIPFVENAFKYSLRNSSKPPTIQISLMSTNQTLTFAIANSIPSGDLSTTKKGIGLQNVRRQLELFYGGHFSMDVQKSAEMYTVTLTIQL